MVTEYMAADPNRGERGRGDVVVDVDSTGSVTKFTLYHPIADGVTQEFAKLNAESKQDFLNELRRSDFNGAFRFFDGKGTESIVTSAAAWGRVEDGSLDTRVGVRGDIANAAFERFRTGESPLSANVELEGLKQRGAEPSRVRLSAHLDTVEKLAEPLSELLSIKPLPPRIE